MKFKIYSYFKNNPLGKLSLGIEIRRKPNFVVGVGLILWLFVWESKKC